MKILALAVFAVTLALASLNTASSNAPQSQAVPQPQLETAQVAPPDPLNPRLQFEFKVDQRLAAVDQRVAELKDGCAETSGCVGLEMTFKKLEPLRAKVLLSLANLRDPMIGLEAARSEVGASLVELELTIQALSANVEHLAPQLSASNF